MEPEEIAAWAKAHGFRQTGSNAWSADHLGVEYQIVLHRDRFVMQRSHPGAKPTNHARQDYAAIRLDEFGMLQNAGLAEAFVRRMWHDGSPPPVWFPEEYTAHAREALIPLWEGRIANKGPR